MNRTAVLRGAGHVAAPAALVLGTSLSTLAIIGTGPARQVAQPPAVTASSSTSTSTPPVSRPPHPSPRTSTGAVAAGRDTAGSSGAQDDRPGTIAPSGPSPAPQPPGSGRTGGIRAAVWLSHPLGVLPDARLALTVGGNRR